MSRTFGRDSARGKLESIIAKLATLETDRDNRDIAISYAADSWHLCDWVFKEVGGRLEHASLRSLQDDVRATCPEIEIMRDICTEDKHAEITRWTPSVDATRQDLYVEPGYVEDGFVESRLIVITASGSEVPFLSAARSVADFWQSYFSKHGIS